jgi:acetyl esterase
VARDRRVSPLLADDHSGLPPTFIATAEYDPLRDDGRAYHAKLNEAGVPVTSVEYDGMIHGLYRTQGIADGAKRLHADLAEAIREVLQPKLVQQD